MSTLEACNHCGLLEVCDGNYEYCAWLMSQLDVERASKEKEGEANGRALHETG